MEHDLKETNRNLLLDYVLGRLEASQYTIQRLPLEKRMLQSIDNEVIIQQIGMDHLSLILFLMKVKNDQIGMLPIENDHVITSGRLCVANTSYLPIFIHFFRSEGDKLIIEGNIAVPTVFGDDSRLIVDKNGYSEEAELYDSGMDSYCGAYRYEDRRKFRISLPLLHENEELRFYYMLNGEKCRIGKIIGMRFSPIADVLSEQYCVRNGYIFFIRGDSIFCAPASSKLTEEMEQKFQRELREIGSLEAQNAIQRRQEYFRRKKQKKNPIWIFMDRPDQADDNAEVLYRYVKEKGFADAYFIIQKGTKDYNRLQNLGGIVPFYSEEHYQLVMLADYIISSQANGAVENPFWDEAEYYRDLYHQGEIIFLQHGVIKDDMSPTLNRYHTNFTGFITSNKAESNSIINGQYGYTDRQVWLTGLPRFDKLYNDPKNYILIIPSWRMGLMEQVWNEETKTMEWSVLENFENSEYKAAWRHLLKNEELQNACKTYGYRVAFMPHPLMKRYFSDMESEQKQNYEYWGRLKSHREALAQGSILVTDYSSITYDFVFLEKPVLYYQFDRELFFSSHTYKKGYFDYEKDGFGEIAFDEGSLVNNLVNYLANDCKVKEVFRSKMQEAFTWHDQNACKRIYERLIQRLE